MEGYGDTDAEFLDDSATIIPGAPGAIRLDNREKLVDDGSWHQPEALTRSGGSCINDLSIHRWYSRFLNPDQEIDAISRIQAADICGPLRSSFQGFRYFAKLLAPFHWQILKLARKPSRNARRGAGKDKHTDTLFYQDLVAAGVAAMWKAALHFDLATGYRFWTPTHIAVVGAISDEARLWRRGGSGESRLDRWLYTHPTASPEQVLRAQKGRVKRPVFHSLQEAAEGIKQFWAWGTDTGIDFDEDMEAAAGPFRSMYDCFDPYQLSYSYSDSDGMAAPADSRLPYLKLHERFSLVVDRLSGGLDTGCDPIEVKRPKSPRDKLDYTETAVVRFKKGTPLRRVERQKARPGYRIRVTAELQTRALNDLEFAKQRWQRVTRRWPMPAQTYPRWSTKFGVERAELEKKKIDENREIVPAFVPITRFKWEVKYRDAAGDVLSVLESPSWHCRYRKQPCEFCEAARGRSRSHHVTLAATLPRRAVGRGSAAVDIRSQNSRTKPRTAETRLEQEKCQTQFAKLRG